MTDPAYTQLAPDRLHRISFGENGIALRSWDAAKAVDILGKKTFGHRWDDPDRVFRSLYTASSVQGAFLETLQELRPNLAFLAGLEAIQLEPGEELPSYDTLDASYFENQYACDIVVETVLPFIEVLHTEIVSFARQRLAGLATHLRLPNVDASTILGPVREFTQALARTIWEPGYAGICAPSTLGLPYNNWTVFETGRETNVLRAELTVVKADPIALDHSDLVDALNVLHMSIDHGSLLLRANPYELGRVDTPAEK